MYFAELQALNDVILKHYIRWISFKDSLYSVRRG
jgi:hypothetical protein